MAISLTTLVPNDKIAQPSGTAIAADDTYEALPVADIPLNQLILLITVATAATTVTIKAGTQPLAIASGQGNLVFTSLATGSYLIGPFDASRFEQNDGTVLIKAATGANVTVRALRVPRNT